MRVKHNEKITIAFKHVFFFLTSNLDSLTFQCLILTTIKYSWSNINTNRILMPQLIELSTIYNCGLLVF